jgi:hypothetical protein
MTRLGRNFLALSAFICAHLAVPTASSRLSEGGTSLRISCSYGQASCFGLTGFDLIVFVPFRLARFDDGLNKLSFLMFSAHCARLQRHLCPARHSYLPLVNFTAKYNSTSGLRQAVHGRISFFGTFF